MFDVPEPPADAPAPPHAGQDPGPEHDMPQADEDMQDPPHPGDYMRPPGGERIPVPGSPPTSPPDMFDIGSQPSEQEPEYANPGEPMTPSKRRLPDHALEQQ